jgi:hypothetical protein
MGLKAAKEAARSVADLLEWSEYDIENQVKQYSAYVKEHFVASPIVVERVGGDR